MTIETQTARKANRLSREKSPYLLQHQFNPVDWRAWNAEAFEEARRFDKPIFLSIGYSTCHWCHVMERESFESEELAAYLNEHFVSIKVDREERPDVDKIYMTFVQARFGHGGWPLNVFLTPDLKPFYGGTYFPPQSRYGQPGFIEVLRQVSEVWRGRREDVLESAGQVHEALKGFTSQKSMESPALTPETLREAGRQLKAHYDPRHGGFGGAPKFPQPSHPAFLLRYGARFHDEEAVRMVLHTCRAMAAGGIRDQLGGGFARYAVDAEWLVPHFEKMLYDQAQLVNLYLDAHLVARGERSDGEMEKWSDESSTPVIQHSNTPFADVARDTLRYVLRDMTHPDGGFFSAEDADSEGHEGKFYCWTRVELEKLLTADEMKVAVRFFGITEQGNFVDHSHPQPLSNENVLSIVDSNLTEAEQPLLASAKEKMFAARSKRVRPHLDDKILASWNGLMLGAMARAYAVLGDETYRKAAERNLAFVQGNLFVAGDSSKSESSKARVGTLFHRWRDSERDDVQLLEGYAFLLSGVIDLYEATLTPKHLDFAIALAESMLVKFYDAENGGFWQSPRESADLILRVKDDYDGAEPSGNSVAILALLKLSKITGRRDFGEAAEKSLRLFAARMQQLPQAVPFMLQTLDLVLHEPSRVVIAGMLEDSRTRDLLHAAHAVFQPGKVVLGNTGAVEPFARTLTATENGVAAYVCKGNACELPTSDETVLKKMLKAA